MMKKKETRHKTLQALCREYLGRARDLARRHGLADIVDELIRSNRRGTCVATEDEVEAIARLVDDERVTRTDIPRMMGKSYRECFDDDDFEHIKKLPRVGIYSNVSARLYANEHGRHNKGEIC